MLKPKEITPLEKYRRLRGYTQSELSEIVGVNKLTISRWERSTEAWQSVKVFQLKKVADALGVTIDKLIGGE